MLFTKYDYLICGNRQIIVKKCDKFYLNFIFLIQLTSQFYLKHDYLCLMKMNY